MNEHDHNIEPEELEALFNQIVDEGIAVILKTHSFDALHKHLCTLFSSVGNDPTFTADDAALDIATRALATRSAFDLWNSTPVLDNGFKPFFMPLPAADEKCLCGSGKAFGACCGALTPPAMILPPDEMALRALLQVPPARIGDIQQLGLPMNILGSLATEWLHQQRYHDAVTLLAPRFKDMSLLDDTAENAADTLLIAYAALHDDYGYLQHLNTLRSAPSKLLACLPLQRDALSAANAGDPESAWAFFDQAMRCTPGNPALANLEILLLLQQGRQEEARARADFWTRSLAAAPDQDHSLQIQRLNFMISEEGQRYILQQSGFTELGDEVCADELDPELEARLDALPQTYAQRRLVLRVELLGIEPPIWRQIEVENNISFAELHLILQEVMGWEDAHLHEFKVGKELIGMHDAFGEGYREAPLPEDEVELGQLLGKRKHFDYIYDFGDEWRHRITIEQRKPSNPKLAPVLLLAGKRACPPEDCGGEPGYYQLLEIMADPSNEEHAETMQWLGDWKPERFNMAAARKRVTRLIKG